MTQRLGWALPGLGGPSWWGRQDGAKQMAPVLTVVLLVTWALVHQDEWLELMFCTINKEHSYAVGLLGAVDGLGPGK